MPDRDYQLEERLEALVRLSAPGELGDAFHDKAPEAIRGGRRRKNPRTGGVLLPKDSKASWAVNIRPKNWGNRDKIWLGKLKSMEEAQRIADIIFHYLGCGPAHSLFPNAGERPPPFLNDNLRSLDSVEKRMKYVKHIAKGDEFLARRKELMDGVKEMVKYLTSRQDEVCVDSPTDGGPAFGPGFAVADPFLCDVRSPPELGVESFDEAYGRRGLNVDFPGLLQEEIDSMMSFLLADHYTC